nr:hypothetical protein [Tanacetum cinerariifolium]
MIRDFDIFSDQEEYSEEEVAETITKTMEQHMSKTQANYGSGIARPKIKELRDNTFSSSDHEDVNEHSEKVLEIPYKHNNLGRKLKKVNDKVYAAQAMAFIKKANDVVKLQALIDGKKVVVTKDVIRQDLCLDDADGVKCFPNDEIFAELARMGYEKPPPKLTFYKAFFSAQ